MFANQYFAFQPMHKAETAKVLKFFFIVTQKRSMRGRLSIVVF